MQIRVQAALITILALATLSHFAWRVAPGQPGLLIGIARQPGDAVPSVMVSPLHNVLTSMSNVDLQTIGGLSCRILYFFDPACAACRTGAEMWRGAKSELDAHVEVVWVSVGEDLETAQAFVGDLHMEVPVYRVTQTDAHKLGLYGTPMVWGTTGNGIIAFTKSGALATSPDSLRSRLDWCRS